jgi:hypothetical protein
LEENGVLVHDEANCSLEVWAAFIFANDGQWIQGENGPVPYAPDFGLIRPAYCVKSKIQKRHLTTFIPYPNFIEGESGGDAVEDHLRGEFSAALWRRDSKKRSTLQASFIEDGDRKARPVSDETS